MRERVGCELIAERIGAESLAVRHRRPLAALERRHSLLDDFELASLVGSHHGCDELSTDAFQLVKP